MNKIKGIILAAGKSSRMYPLSNRVHKSLIFLMGKPILFYTVEALRNAGIKDLVIVINPKSLIDKYFGNGKKFGVNIQYVIQEKPEGAGKAVLLAEKYIRGDFLLLNASHVDVSGFIKDLVQAKSADKKAVLLVKKRNDTWNQGVLELRNKKVNGIVEKPKKGEEPSNLCVVGIYLFQKDFLETIKQTPKEHYQLEKAISKYAKENNIQVVETKKDTVTLKYPWDILDVKNYLLKKIGKSIGKKAKVAKSAEIIGDVIVEDGAKIMEGARIKGPCYVGKNAVIGNNALVRNGVDVEENCVIGANMEVKNSLIMKNTTTHSGFIGDSVIGENCKIAAQFCTANAKFDRKNVRAIIKNELIETDHKYLGVMVGRDTKIGIKSSTMPGVIIGRGVTIGPSTVVMHNVLDNTKYYTKFQEIVNEKL